MNPDEGKIPGLENMTHFHDCVCGVSFECRIDILPAWPLRALWKEWPESVCPSCLSNLIEHSTPETIERMVEILKDFDPLTVTRVKEFCG